MKRIAFFLVSLVISLSCLAENGANIQFKTRVHDFGEINEDDKTATCVFTFTNVGNQPLIIHRAIASCGCTTPKFTPEPIVPGASGNIQVTYNTVGRPYAFNKTITVYCNDPQTPTVLLTIKGSVIPSAENPEQSYPKNMEGLRLNKTQLSILDAKIGSIRTETINVINTNSKPVRISFRKVPSYLRIVTSDAILRPKGTATITVSYLASQAKDYGRKEDSFYIVLNNNIKNCTNNKINVSAYITEDFSKLSPEQLQNAPAGIYSENRINFGKMAKKGRKVQYITLTNTGKSPLFIRKIVPEYQGLKVTPDRNVLQAGKTMRIKLDFNIGNFSGNIVQRVTIFTNDPKNSISRLFATAQVD
ncbi:MAG: DUF1573 domain-containing protein [Bacteroidota bacterium]|nr:DUF1573 domain-containing protein [Bacteroidota bacterium]